MVQGTYLVHVVSVEYVSDVIILRGHNILKYDCITGFSRCYCIIITELSDDRCMYVCMYVCLSPSWLKGFSICVFCIHTTLRSRVKTYIT